MQPASVTAPAAVFEMTEPVPDLTSSLRPGVTFPDWSVVTSASARAALVAMLETGWDRRAWHGYTPAEDAVRQTILELYLDLGQAPSPEEIARRAGTGPDLVRPLLKRLATRDLIVLEDDEIIGAYPLTDQPSDHRVVVADRALHAMCAIDALGVGAMYRTDTTITSRCRRCHAPIDIAIADGGRCLASLSPAGAVVFASVGYRSGCAATSLCTTISFFCGGAHLSAWSQPCEGPTFRLSIGKALEVGRAIFGPVLAPSALDVPPASSS